MVKALDCGVRGHRFKSHQLLPREGFSPRIFLLEFSLPTGENLNISRWCFLSNPLGKNECKKKKKKKKKRIIKSPLVSTKEWFHCITKSHPSMMYMYIYIASPGVYI